MYPTIKNTMRREFEAQLRSQVGVSGAYQGHERDIVLRTSLNGQSSLVLNLQDQATPLNERDTRVGIKEAFGFYAIAIGVQKMKTTNGVTVPISDILTFADSSVFVGAGKAGTATEISGIKTVWDSRLSFSTSNLVRFDKFHTRNALHVPGAVVAGNSPLRISEEDTDKGFYNLSDLVLVKGNESNKITFNFPYQSLLSGIMGGFNASGADLAGEFNELVITLKGFVAVDVIK